MSIRFNVHKLKLGVDFCSAISFAAAATAASHWLLHNFFFLFLSTLFALVRCSFCVPFVCEWTPFSMALKLQATNFFTSIVFGLHQTKSFSITANIFLRGFICPRRPACTSIIISTLRSSPLRVHFGSFPPHLASSKSIVSLKRRFVCASEKILFGRRGKNGTKNS